MASYFHYFAQTNPNHQGHSPAAVRFMPDLEFSTLFVITSCREVSVIGVRLLARGTGIEPVPPRS